MKLLLEAGADPDGPEEDWDNLYSTRVHGPCMVYPIGRRQGMSLITADVPPIIMAARHLRLDIIELLLDFGAKARVGYNPGATVRDNAFEVFKEVLVVTYPPVKVGEREKKDEIVLDRVCKEGTPITELQRRRPHFPPETVEEFQEEIARNKEFQQLSLEQRVAEHRDRLFGENEEDASPDKGKGKDKATDLDLVPQPSTSSINPSSSSTSTPLRYTTSSLLSLRNNPPQPCPINLTHIPEIAPGQTPLPSARPAAYPQLPPAIQSDSTHTTIPFPHQSPRSIRGAGPRPPTDPTTTRPTLFYSVVRPTPTPKEYRSVADMIIAQRTARNRERFGMGDMSGGVNFEWE